jgi:hypothetical protein
MGSPFDGLSAEPGSASSVDFLYWLVAILLLFGLFFGSFIYNETKGDGGSSPAPIEDHHDSGGEEVPF